MYESFASAVALRILAYIQTYIKRTKSKVAREALSYVSLELTTARIFHDILTRLLAVRIDNSEHSKLKNAAIRSWREHGRLFDLREGRDVTTTESPSELSEELAYWRIPKRCFLNECPCSANTYALHRVRVCKGCYRVLYCNEECQMR